MERQQSYISIKAAESGFPLRTVRRHTPLISAREMSQNEQRSIELLLLRREPAGDFDAERRDDAGRTLLSHAAGHGWQRVVALLLRRRDPPVDVNAQDACGRTPLTWAAANGHANIVKQLLHHTPNNDNSGGFAVELDSRDSIGLTPLMHAAAAGHTDVVRLLLGDRRSSEIDPDAVAGNGGTPLLWATALGHSDVVRLLIRHLLGLQSDGRGSASALQVAVNRRDNEGVTPLALAAKNGHLDVARELLLLRADVVVDAGVRPFNSGATPLHLACASGSAGIVELLLLDRATRAARASRAGNADGGAAVVVDVVGVDVHSRDSRGRTPLAAAAIHGDADIVALLLAHNGGGDDDHRKVDASAPSLDGVTPLMWAAIGGNSSVVGLLLARNDVEADARDGVDRTALSYAAEAGHVDVVNQLLACSAVDSSRPDNCGCTPLMFAAACGHYDVAELLLRRYNETGAGAGLTADACDNEGCRALGYAAGQGHARVVRLLLARADVNADAADRRGQTALALAAAEGHLAVVKLLLDSNIADGVEADHRNADGHSPLALAAAKGHPVIVRALLELNRLSDGVAAVDVDAADRLGRTPLLLAAAAGHPSVVALLLGDGEGMRQEGGEAGRGVVADVNAADAEGLTPLTHAAAAGRMAVMRLLLDHSDVDAQRRANNGGTPLAFAAARGHAAAVRLLLARLPNIDIDGGDNDGRTALALAAEDGHYDVVDLLLNDDYDNEEELGNDGDSRQPQRRANANLADHKGLTPLALAAVKGHAAVVARLLRPHSSSLAFSNKDEDGVRQLRQAVDVNCLDSRGRTPLMFAAIGGHEAVVHVLLQVDAHAGLGLGVNARSYCGATALSYAAEMGYEGVVKLLLGRSSSSLSSHREGSVGGADASGSPEPFEITDIDARDSTGKTPLAWAAHQGHASVAELLLAYAGGGDDDARGGDDNADEGSDGAGEDKRKHRVGEDSTTRDVGQYVDPNARNADGHTPLAWAAAHGRADVVELLIARDNVEINTRDRLGRSPLASAALMAGEWARQVARCVFGDGGGGRDDDDGQERGRPGSTPREGEGGGGSGGGDDANLAQPGAEASKRPAGVGADGGMGAPVSTAPSRSLLERDYAKVVKLLLSRRDVDARARDSTGQTPLMFARRGYEDVMDLVRAGSDADVAADLTDAADTAAPAVATPRDAGPGIAQRTVQRLPRFLRRTLVEHKMIGEMLAAREEEGEGGGGAGRRDGADDDEQRHFSWTTYAEKLVAEERAPGICESRRTFTPDGMVVDEYAIKLRERPEEDREEEEGGDGGRAVGRRPVLHATLGVQCAAVQVFPGMRSGKHRQTAAQPAAPPGNKQRGPHKSRMAAGPENAAAIGDGGGDGGPAKLSLAVRIGSAAPKIKLVAKHSPAATTGPLSASVRKQAESGTAASKRKVRFSQQTP